MTSNMVFLGDNQNSVCILSAPEVVGICLRSIVALGSLSLPTPSSSASSHNCVGSCRYSATNNLNILFNFSTVGKWTVLRLSPLLCHCLGNGVAITCKIGTPENKITRLFEAFHRQLKHNIMVVSESPLLTPFLKRFVVIFDASASGSITTGYKYSFVSCSSKQAWLLKSRAIIHQHFLISPKPFIPIL